MGSNLVTLIFYTLSKNILIFILPAAAFLGNVAAYGRPEFDNCVCDLLAGTVQALSALNAEIVSKHEYNLLINLKHKVC